MAPSIKILGRRRPAAGLEAGAAWLDAVQALRGARPFVPKGLYRFATFEDAQAWARRMMARSTEGSSRRPASRRPPR